MTPYKQLCKSVMINMNKPADLMLKIYGLDTKKTRNEVATRIREAKEQYCIDLVKENMHNSKSLWKILKLLLPGKHKNGAQSFVVNGELETDPKVVATVFNNFVC